MKIKIIKDYRDCWKKGTVGEVNPEFGVMLIQEGFAKAVDEPDKNKMVSSPKKKKGYYV